ncbi:MAG: GNAT family N-acetyltransferase [Bacteroidota bacterium]
MQFDIHIAGEAHYDYAQAICDLIEASAKIRGTGIAKREPDYVRTKMQNGNAIIALAADGQLAGFCYIEVWSHEKYVANSGLIVNPDFRQMGLAKRIKQRAFRHARDKYPNAKVFGITTSLAVMKINSELGYKPVTFSELTQDDAFWNGCRSCPNFDILERNHRKLCLCTGMLAPSKEEAPRLDISNQIINQQTNEQ